MRCVREKCSTVTLDPLLIFQVSELIVPMKFDVFELEHGKQGYDLIRLVIVEKNALSQQCLPLMA